MIVPLFHIEKRTRSILNGCFLLTMETNKTRLRIIVIELGRMKFCKEFIQIKIITMAKATVVNLNILKYVASEIQGANILTTGR